ncbi:MAG: SET domain-containing protein-lysine N-methyltransferase, partial [Clostridia bacterium]
MLVKENIDNYLNEKSYSIGFFNPYDEKEKIQAKTININDIGDKLEKQKEAYLTPATEVIRVKNGYIVKATENFRKGDIIERAPVILQSSDILKYNQLKDIVFEIDKENGIYGLVLGNGSLYSHSDQPNLDYAWDKIKSRMCFITRKKIAKGEILTINYGFEYWNDRT